MARVSVLVGVLLCAGLCGAVMDKIMIGSCCNDDNSYSYQESWIGRKYTVVGLFGEFCQDSFYSWSFGVILDNWKAGRVSHYSLNPQTSDGCFPNGAGGTPPPAPADPNRYILDGHFDTYIGFFVARLKTFLAGPDGTLGNGDDRRIYIRLSHELNGNWYAWSSDPNSYAMMWRYVYNKVMGGTGFTKSHVQWVFEPVSPYEPDANHDFRLYWPGDQYVDWLSLDAYEDGSELQSWYQPWEIFDTIL